MNISTTSQTTSNRISQPHSASPHDDTTDPTASLEQPVARSRVKEFFSGVGGYALLVSQVILWVAFAVVALTFFFFSISGFQMDRVLTGSMEPTIMTGDVIVTRGVHGDDLRVGQIVKIDHGSYTVTHRIISVDDKGTEERSDDTAITQGDANNTPDLFNPTQKDLSGVFDHTLNEQLAPLIGSFSIKPNYLADIMDGKATPSSVIAGAPWGLITWIVALVLVHAIIPSRIERHSKRRARRESVRLIQAVNPFASKE